MRKIVVAGFLLLAMQVVCAQKPAQPSDSLHVLPAPGFKSPVPAFVQPFSFSLPFLQQGQKKSALPVVPPSPAMTNQGQVVVMPEQTRVSIADIDRMPVLQPSNGVFEKMPNAVALFVPGSWVKVTKKRP